MLGLNREWEVEKASNASAASLCRLSALEIWEMPPSNGLATCEDLGPGHQRIRRHAVSGPGNVNNLIITSSCVIRKKLPVFLWDSSLIKIGLCYGYNFLVKGGSLQGHRS